MRSPAVNWEEGVQEKAARPVEPEITAEEVDEATSDDEVGELSLELCVRPSATPTATPMMTMMIKVVQIPIIHHLLLFRVDIVATFASPPSDSDDGFSGVP